MKTLSRLWSLAGRIILPLSIVLYLAIPGFGQQKTWHRFEFDIATGYGLNQLEGGSRYAREWDFKYIENVTESSNLSMRATNEFSFRAGFSYFFTPIIGIQIGGGYFSPDLPMDGLFNYQIKWRGNPAYNETRRLFGGGKVRSVPLFLNLAGKLRTKIVDFNLTAGPAVYFNRFEATSSTGFTDLYYEEEWMRGWHLEYIGVLTYIAPMKVRKSWTAFGGNAGIGIDFRVVPGVAMGVEGRYFLMPNKSLRWEWIPGKYPELHDPCCSFGEYSAAQLKEFEARQTATKVKPSFFSISFAIKLALGRR